MSCRRTFVSRGTEMTSEETYLGRSHDRDIFLRTRPSILDAQQSNNMRAEERRGRKNFYRPSCNRQHARALCVPIQGGAETNCRREQMFITRAAVQADSGHSTHASIAVCRRFERGKLKEQ
jgi:hypothetical protein